MFIDTESIVEHHDDSFSLPFRMGWSCYINQLHKKTGNVEDWQYFDTKYDMCEYIFSKTYEKTCLYVFAHNIFHDLRVLDLFSYAHENLWTINKFVDQGKTAFLKIRRDKASIMFLSTTNFFPFSLKVLGKAIGVEKGEVDFEKDDDKTISTYCKQDVNIIKITILELFKYLKGNNLGGFCITAASQALQAFRFRFMKHKIFPVDDEEVIEYERKAYHGGRTECFHIGDLSSKNIKVYDINSMYPYVMKENYYPVYAKYIIDSPSDKQLRKLLRDFCAIADVTLRTKENAYAHVHERRLIFPVGCFRTTLSTPELLYAIDHDHLFDVHRVILYNKAKIFVDYVNFFYKNRLMYKKLNNLPYITLTKLFLNCLYGKFGQQGCDQTIKPTYDFQKPYRHRIIDLETGKTYWETGLINTEILDVDGEKPRHTFTAIAAHVTAYARMYLWKLIKKAGQDHVFYCDTDSLFVDSVGEHNIRRYIDAMELGKLKLEKQPHSMRIYGLKDYVIDGKMTIKGIRKNAKHLTKDEMKAYLRDDKLSDERYLELRDSIWKQEQFESLKSAIKNERTDKAFVKYVIKKLRREYTKGIVTRSGKIKPFRL